MYMLGRRRTCSRPSRTWICSAVYATSAHRAWGLREPSGRGFLTAITGVLALPARRKLRGQLGGTSEPEFYRISNTKLGSGRPLTGPLGRGFRGRFPAQDRLLALAQQVGVDATGGAHFVEAADRQVFGLLVQRLRIGFRLRHDGLDGAGEGVERGLALRLCGLDHDRLRNHEREVDRGRVEAAIEQRLRDVEGAHAVLVAQVSGAGDELVHAGTLVRHLQVLLDELTKVV